MTWDWGVREFDRAVDWVWSWGDDAQQFEAMVNEAASPWVILEFAIGHLLLAWITSVKRDKTPSERAMMWFMWAKAYLWVYLWQAMYWWRSETGVFLVLVFGGLTIPWLGVRLFQRYILGSEDKPEGGE